MAGNLKGRHLLKLLDFAPGEIADLLTLSATLKANKRAGVRGRALEGRNVALIFEKASTRTRCAFVTACVDEGAHPEYLGKGDIQFGKKETVADTARVLGRMFDGIQFRGFSQDVVETLAKHAGVPVWNGLTDQWHPTQGLADLLTVQEEFGRLRGLSLCYVGDGRNNMANELLVGAAKMGMHVRIGTPRQLFPDPALVETARGFAWENGGEVTVAERVEEAVAGAHVIYTDVWASMGEEAKIPERIALLKDYKVTRRLMDLTSRRDAIFLHCLPAFHSLDTDFSRQFPDICEVEDEVFEGPRSRVFDQAENRVHTIKAVMVATIGR
ncbi:MAG: ornithine carbamoyltransferase [Deltaproteobacteria bacterium]|nr:ornithine carbamoyltransferase [Deltaproteobacteria bacterium]